MFDLDHWREIWAALTANKLRTALTALGVFWGLFLLMVMLGSGNGLENGVTRDFGGTATNRSKRSKDHNTQQAEQHQEDNCVEQRTTRQWLLLSL